MSKSIARVLVAAYAAALYTATTLTSVVALRMNASSSLGNGADSSAADDVDYDSDETTMSDTTWQFYNPATGIDVDSLDAARKWSTDVGVPSSLSVASASVSAPAAEVSSAAEPSKAIEDKPWSTSFVSLDGWRKRPRFEQREPVSGKKASWAWSKKQRNTNKAVHPRQRNSSSATQSATSRSVTSHSPPAGVMDVDQEHDRGSSSASPTSSTSTSASMLEAAQAFGEEGTGFEDWGGDDLKSDTEPMRHEPTVNADRLVAPGLTVYPEKWLDVPSGVAEPSSGIDLDGLVVNNVFRIFRSNYLGAKDWQSAKKSLSDMQNLAIVTAVPNKEYPVGDKRRTHDETRGWRKNLFDSLRNPVDNLHELDFEERSMEKMRNMKCSALIKLAEDAEWWFVAGDHDPRKKGRKWISNLREIIQSDERKPLTKHQKLEIMWLVNGFRHLIDADKCIKIEDDERLDRARYFRREKTKLFQAERERNRLIEKYLAESGDKTFSLTRASSSGILNSLEVNSIKWSNSMLKKGAAIDNISKKILHNSQQMGKLPRWWPRLLTKLRHVAFPLIANNDNRMESPEDTLRGFISSVGLGQVDPFIGLEDELVWLQGAALHALTMFDLIQGVEIEIEEDGSLPPRPVESAMYDTFKAYLDALKWNQAKRSAMGLDITEWSFNSFERPSVVYYMTQLEALVKHLEVPTMELRTRVAQAIWWEQWQQLWWVHQAQLWGLPPPVQDDNDGGWLDF